MLDKEAHLMRKRIGIVGGLGTETSCTLCLRLNNRIRKTLNCQPNLVMENVPIPLSLERETIQGKPPKEMFLLLSRAVENLKSANLIAIPCNSVHVFLDGLRKISNNVLSIMEETAKECQRKGFKKVGLLATQTTIKKELHKKELNKHKIKLIIPSEKEQAVINKIILDLLNSKPVDCTSFNEIISNLRKRGAQAVILGCTDLQLVIKDSPLPVIDTLQVLEDSIIHFLTDLKDPLANKKP